MTPAVVADELTPIARLQLRETLQDLWRDQVRRITLLSLSMYDDLDAQEPTTTIDVEMRSGRTDVALVESRELLAALEAAMRRLDDRTYGRCARCGTTIGYEQLATNPLASCCAAHSPEPAER